MTSKEHEIEVYETPLPLLFQANVPLHKSSLFNDVGLKEDKLSIDKDHISVNILVTEQGECNQKIQDQKRNYSFLAWISSIKSTWKIGRRDVQKQLWSADIARLIGALCLMTSSLFVHRSEDWQFANSILYPLRSQWGFNIFLVLIGRAFVSEWNIPQKSKYENNFKDAVLTSSVVYKMGQSLLLRPFRFFLPIIVIQALQRKVCESAPSFSQGYAYLFDQAYRDGWCTPDSNISLITRIISLFTENNSSQLVEQTGMLYQSPFLFQASLYALGIVLLTAHFRTTSRTFLLIFLAFMNWSTYSFLFPVMLGFLIGDLQQSEWSIKIFPSELSLKGVIRRKAFLLVPCIFAAFITLLFIPVIRDNLSNGMEEIQTLQGIATKPTTTQGFRWIRFSDCISAALFVLWLETLQPFNVGFCTTSIAFLGRHLSAGLIVLHPIVIYGILPHIFQNASVDFSGHNTILILKMWASTLFITLGLAIPFRLLIELGSLFVGKLFVACFLPDST